MTLDDYLMDVPSQDQPEEKFLQLFAETGQPAL